VKIKHGTSTSSTRAWGLGRIRLAGVAELNIVSCKIKGLKNRKGRDIGIAT